MEWEVQEEDAKGGDDHEIAVWYGGIQEKYAYERHAQGGVQVKDGCERVAQQAGIQGKIFKKEMMLVHSDA